VLTRRKEAWTRRTGRWSRCRKQVHGLDMRPAVLLSKQMQEWLVREAKGLGLVWFGGDCRCAEQ